MKKDTILCMFSGGIDSTGALWKLLNDKEYFEFNIHVHHVNLINKENRAKAEYNASFAIIKEMSDLGVRPFGFSSSVLDTSFLVKPIFNRFLFDAESNAYISASICLCNTSIRRVVVGYIEDDCVDDKGRFRFGTTERMKTVENIFNATLSAYPVDKYELPFYDYILLDHNKQQVWNGLPESIRKLTHTCRHPQYGVDDRVITCNKCHGCEARKALES